MVDEPQTMPAAQPADWQVMVYDQVDVFFREYVNTELAKLIGAGFTSSAVETFQTNLKIMVNRRDQVNAIVASTTV